MSRMMKILCMIVMALVVASAVASAEEQSTLEIGQVTLLEDGQRVDLNGDGQAETIGFAIQPKGEDEDVGQYVLTVNGAQATGEGYALTGKVYALRMASFPKITLLLVSEYGMSDDDYAYGWVYDGEALLNAGGIASSPDSMSVGMDLITANVRGSVLQTWFHSADFTLAQSYQYDEETEKNETLYRLASVPRFSYPMGTVVTCKMELPLLTSANPDAKIALTIKAGERVVLAASDDVRFVYIERYEPNWEDDHQAGWLDLGEDMISQILVNGVATDATEVFDGLLMAD